MGYFSYIFLWMSFVSLDYDFSANEDFDEFQQRFYKIPPKWTQ